jgi:hypothetical protein
LVEARVKVESRGRTEGPGEASLKCFVLAVKRNNAGAAGTEDFMCSMELREEACSEERRGRGRDVVAGEVGWGA